MNADEQKARHSQLTQLRADLEKAIGVTDEAIDELDQAQLKLREDHDALVARMELSVENLYRTIDALKQELRNDIDGESRKRDALATRYLEDHARGFLGRLKLLLLGR